MTKQIIAATLLLTTACDVAISPAAIDFAEDTDNIVKAQDLPPTRSGAIAVAEHELADWIRVDGETNDVHFLRKEYSLPEGFDDYDERAQSHHLWAVLACVTAYEEDPSLATKTNTSWEWMVALRIRAAVQALELHWKYDHDEAYLYASAKSLGHYVSGVSTHELVSDERYEAWADRANEIIEDHVEEVISRGSQ